MGRDSQPSLIYAIGPSNKKFKIDGGTIHLKNDAIIINGAVEGTKHFEEGYGFQEIGYDLLSLTQEAARETVRLVNAVNGNTATAAVEAVAALGPPDHDYRPSGSNSLEQRGSGVPPATNEDINALYYKTFQSMNKSIFLLSQWKSSWESTMSAASNTVADASLAEAVASAAAVVAAASSSTSLAGPEADQGQDQNNPSMVSLLLAADKSNDSVSEMATAVAEHVQDQVDWPMQPEVQARYYQQDTGEGDASDDACEYAV